jgi:anaerobic selenocysteine-containing dehydrogenase
MRSIMHPSSHAKVTAWPARVDGYLADGLAESDVDHWVLSACLLCSNGCGCDIAVKDGRMVGVRGRATDVVNHGRLGPKGPYVNSGLPLPRLT